MFHIDICERALATEHCTAFKLVKALSALEQPIFITDGVAKSWLSKYHGDQRAIHNAGKLELECGDGIREHFGTEDIRAESLRDWLRQRHKVMSNGCIQVYPEARFVQ